MANTDTNDIKVSVFCLTHNHDNFVEKALDSVVMQETNFKFEIIVHDDASTDNTAMIVKKYENEYKHLFKCIYQEVNQHSVDDRLYIRFLFPIAQGKYIAYCESDDYWTDPLKLQKQYDFMEENPEYSSCYHSYKKRINGVISNVLYPIKPKDFSKNDLIATPRYLELLTRFEKNLYPLCPKEDLYNFSGHFLSNAYLGTIGPCKYLKDIKPSVKNIHPTGTWSRKSEVEKAITRVWIGTELYNLFLKRNIPEEIHIRLSTLKNTLLESDPIIGYSKNCLIINSKFAKIYFWGIYFDMNYERLTINLKKLIKNILSKLINIFKKRN